jgi:hypothetical protein
MVRGTVVKKRPHEIRRNKSIGDEEFYVGKTCICAEILGNTAFTSCWGYGTWITRGSHKEFKFLKRNLRSMSMEWDYTPCRQRSKVH